MGNPSQLLESLVDIVINQGGSDLHLSVGRSPVVRVSTELVTLVNQPKLTAEDLNGILSAVLDATKLEKFKTTFEVDFSYNHKDIARLRGNAYVHKGSTSIAFRLIPKVRTLAELKLPDTLQIFARKKQGFFLVVGPVGQGKSTTLSAMVDFINSERTEHILTIEDPIEYIFEEKHSVKATIISFLNELATFEYGTVDEYNMYAKKIINNPLI